MFGGESAFDVDADWHDMDLVEECMTVLRKISKTPPPQPLDYIVTRWGQDAFARMCFSYVPPNVDGSEALSTLSQPLVSSDGRPMVLFAGEHTTPFHPSTIHGAFLSGIREAYRLDLTLEPQLNNGLAFDPTNLYQKTFGLKRLKNAAVPSQSVLDWANSSRSRTGDEESHRRRHGAMTLRKKKGPSVPAALMSPTRQSVRTSLNDHELEPSRKSQRKSKSPMRWVAASDSDGDDEGNGIGDSAKLHAPNRNGHHGNKAVQLQHLPPPKKSQLRQTIVKRGGDKSILTDWKVGQIKDMKPLSTVVADHVAGTRKSSRKVAQAPRWQHDDEDT
ncbi:oxidoreductase [Fragilaria crotonensis]|nr:oxidoreductase [Fragilaria crotonensis]